MGKENCADSILVQLTNEKSPTTGTSTDTAIGNSSIIVVVVEDDERQQNVQPIENISEASFCKRIYSETLLVILIKCLISFTH